ncbi:holliday junction resolvase [Sporosarcina phage Lietuvens]|nr:holliday junction resolvase [Sporosarcina phage Lietuvens]
MTNFTEITLAMDLSLSSPGFAVLAVCIDNGERKPIILEKSHVKTNPKHSHGARIADIADEIARLMTIYLPQHLVREKGFSRFPAVTQTLFKIVGISDYMAYIHADATVAEISPTSVKKTVAGSGKASKQDVQDAVIRILQIEQADYFANDDESDAAACGIAYLLGKGLIAS